MVLNHCLLRNINPDLCSNTNPAYIGLHGHSGTGGRLGNAGIPQDYFGMLSEDSPLKESLPQVHQSLERYVTSFEKQFEDVKDELRESGKEENEVRVKSLYLWSEEPGTGKTVSATILLQEYLLSNYIGCLKRGITPPQRPVFFLDVNEWQTDYNTFNRPKVPDSIATPASERYYHNMQKAKETEFVVLDDVGVRDCSDGFRGDLHTLINYRVTNRLPTIYTSNIPIEGLEDVFKEKRLVDRIGDLTRPVHFDGDSKRGVKRK